MGPAHCHENNIVISAGYAVCVQEGKGDGLFIKTIFIVLINKAEVEISF
jgi:hypothetical protein